MHVLGEALPEFLAGTATVAVTALFRWTRTRLRPGKQAAHLEKAMPPRPR